MLHLSSPHSHWLADFVVPDNFLSKLAHLLHSIQKEITLLEMEKQNSKLLLANCYMIEENARLRRKAQILDRENQALLSELKRRQQQQPSHVVNSDQGPSTAVHDDLSLSMATASMSSPSSVAPNTSGPGCDT